MMMMRTAGGPTAPVWTREARKTRLPAWMWAGAALSIAAHVGAGVWLLNQRWTPPQPTILEEGPIIDLLPPPPRPKPPRPEPLERTQAKPAPATPLNDAPTPLTPTETLPYTPSDVTEPPAGPIDFTPEPTATTGGTATTPVTEPARLSVVGNPDWVRRPTGAALMEAYPDRALNAGITGSAQLTCTVRVNGTLTGCFVADETPAGQGFGRAALRLSRDFRMSPRTVDGQAVEGARVNVTLRFTLPER